MSEKYAYNKKYADKYLTNFDEIRIRIPKGKKETIKAHAEKCGESVNAFVSRAIEETMQREKEG